MSPAQLATQKTMGTPYAKLLDVAAILKNTVVGIGTMLMAVGVNVENVAGVKSTAKIWPSLPTH